MSEIPAPPAGKEGGRDWSVFAGRYNPGESPIAEEVFADIRHRAREPHMSNETIDRVMLVETAVYAMMLCNLGLAVERVDRQVWQEAGRGAILLTKHTNLDSLHERAAKLVRRKQPPAYEAIADMSRQGFINDVQAGNLKSIVDVVVINESGDRLPAF